MRSRVAPTLLLLLLIGGCAGRRYDDDEGPSPSTSSLHATGQSCAGPSDCELGNVCAAGLCRLTCTADAECGESTSRCCNARLPDSSRVCNLPSSCDPMAPQSSCPAGTACYFVPCGGNLDNAECLAFGTGTVGTSCTLANQCVPGAVCKEVDATGSRCYQICRLGQPVCPSGKTCKPVKIKVGMTEVASTTHGLCF